MTSNDHIWQFARIGGVNRVNLESGSDLLNLEYLDQKLWTALSCQVHGLEIDYKTLEYIDLDKDGRIRTPEVIAAVKWVLKVLRNPDDLLLRSDVMPLTAINSNDEEGRILLASAQQILDNLGKGELKHLTVEDTSDTIRIFASTRFNGDGVVTDDSTDEPALKEIINHIIAAFGGIIDRSGKNGVTAELVNKFYKQCEDYLAWQQKAEDNKTQVWPYGPSTGEAYETLNQIKAKVEDYFVRCRLAAFDPSATGALNIAISRFESISQKELTENMADIATLPLALVEQGKPLPLKTGLNPAWEKAIACFYQLVVSQVYKDKTTLTEAEWQALCSSFDAYASWVSQTCGEPIAPLGTEVIKTCLGNNSKEKLIALIEEDLKLAEQADNITKVDKLVRYYRDLFRLLNNFVTFHDFYKADSKAVFQAGRLYIDQRSCDLCIKVSDMGKHGTMAGLSGICLIYCDCYSKVKNEKMTIVAAFTDGDFDDIIVGRNALFFDNDGLDWDATIIKVIENPISIRQAFWSPYKKFAKFISKQIEKFASAREEKVNATATAGIEKTAAKADEGLSKSVTSEPAPPPPATPAAPPQPFDIGKFVGIFAAIGLAIGAIGSVLAAILSGFLSLVWWKMPLALLGIILAISGPSMILAWLKLRKRNLAPVLDANGWAINAKLTINITFGNTLTHLASLPANAKLNLIDPFKKKKKPGWVIALTALIVLAAAAAVLWYYDIIL